jgi:outer membrane protein assembly factor BamB
MRSLLLACLALSFPSFARADNWPQFRGPNGDGISTAKGLPLTWSETENVRWKTPIPGKAWSSPVLWDDQIWLTNATPDGKRLSAVCVDRTSGKVLHDLTLFELEKPPFCIPYNSYASSTPVIEKGRCYAHFGSNGTACIDTATGKVLWERRDLKCDHWRGAGSSPILHGKLLILVFDGHDVQYVTALDKETGKTVWKTDRNINYTSKDGDLHKAYGTPAVFTIDGKEQLICPSAEATIAYDPATGSEIWRLMHGGMNAATRPLFHDGLIFLTSGHTKLLMAVKSGGKGELTESAIAWKTNKGVPSRPSPVLLGDLLFLVNDEGIASCVEAKTGERLWQERLGPKAGTSASPLCADGRLYFADEEGTTYVVEAARKYKQLAANKLAAGCMASPIAAGKSLFLRTKTDLYCIEQR